MSLTQEAWGEEITYVGTDKLYPLGTLRQDISGTYGPQIWRYVQVDTGVTVTAGLAVKLKNGAPALTGVVVLGTTATPKCRCMGIVQHVIAAASYGWVLCKGWGLGQSDGSVSADTPQTCAASGQLTSGTIGTNEHVGFASEAEAVAAATFLMFVDAL